ncbi:uncharacterized protein [Nicotiana sylvestris]|uniref:uncharacterized protein n=1 Tax=Nicotiana sylvestris TaxID=4096 RepID=UPI00388C3DF0
MFFDGETNFKEVGIGVVLVSETDQYYPVSAKLWFPCTNNMAEYEACILGLKMAIDMNIQEFLVIRDSDLLIHQVREECATKNSKIPPCLHYGQELRKRFTKTEFQHVPRVQNGFANALTTLSSMIQHPNKNFIDPIPVRIHDQPAYCAHVEEKANRKPWFHDIKEYLAKGEYPELANAIQERTLRRLSNNFFHSGGILYRRTPDLGSLRMGEESLRASSSYRWKENECSLPWSTLSEQDVQSHQQKSQAETVHTGAAGVKKIFPYQDEAKGKFSPN